MRVLDEWPLPQKWILGGRVIAVSLGQANC
jgi:hypothetical protein